VTDRVTNEEGNPVIYVPHPFLGIAGCINTKKLPLFLGPNRDGDEDGGIDRFLFGYPDPVPVPDWSWTGLPDEKSRGWKVLIDRLLDRPMRPDEADELAPYIYELDQKGKDAWANSYNQHVAEMRERHFPPELRGPWIKLGEYAGRITLALSLTQYAARRLGDNLTYQKEDTDNKHCKFLWEDAVISAWQLVDYFKVQVRRVQAKIEKVAPAPVGANASRDIQETLRWIERNRRTTFQAKDLEYLRCFRGDPRRRDKALDEMEQDHYIRRLPDPFLKGAKKPSPTYEFNPDLHSWEAPPENNCHKIASDPHIIASDFRANGTGASDPTPSMGGTSNRELVPDPENSCHSCQNCQGEEETPQPYPGGEGTSHSADPLSSTDHPSPTDGLSLPTSLPSSEDLLSADLLPSGSSSGTDILSEGPLLQPSASLLPSDLLTSDSPPGTGNFGNYGN
jgi:hypothetical protein